MMEERNCKSCWYWQGLPDGSWRRTCTRFVWETTWDYVCRSWEPLGREDSEDDGYPD